MKVTKWVSSDKNTEEICSVRDAKRLLKEKGGSAFTLVFDRNGSFVETINIELNDKNKGSYKNSRAFF